MKIFVNNHMTEADRPIVEEMLKLAEKSVPPKTVYAVEKGDEVHMLKDTYGTFRELLEKVHAYREDGYRAYFTTKDGPHVDKRRKSSSTSQWGSR